jgi:hypothetical protein
MKFEFIMCGNHTDAFLSQAAIYRMMLDSFGGDYAASRLVLCVGGPERVELPPRWREAFKRIELVWVYGDAYTLDDFAQSAMTYSLVDPAADLSVICDADTLMLRPFPEDFLAEMKAAPALVGSIAHFPPPLHDARVDGARVKDTAELWDSLARKLLPGPLPMPYNYSLLEDEVPAPFYVNLGFLAGSPKMLRAFHAELQVIVPLVRDLLENEFYEQIAVPFAVARAGLPVRAVPLRFNYPNCPVAHALHPQEIGEIVNLHYLRTHHFDRHRIFADPAAFEHFMGLELDGSNAVFQQAVRKLTGGVYPFPA